MGGFIKYTLKSKNNIILTLLILFFVSCKISGSFHGLYSYYKKEYKLNPDLYLKANDTNQICGLNAKNDLKVIIVNGNQLKACLKKFDKSIVYLWSPKCKSQFCYSPTLVQAKSDLQIITLFVVAEYYETKLMQFDYILKYNILGIDTDFYNSNLTETYKRKFFEDLELYNIENERFFYFEKGDFIKKFSSINEIETIY